jgi:hypothetical protein
MQEAQVRLLIVAIPRFIQIGMPLPPLKLMGQSRRGVMGLLEVQVSLLPHAVIDPSALRAAKAYEVE